MTTADTLRRWLGTLSDLRECGANPVALGALMILGEAAQDIANTASLPLVSLVTEPNVIFTPDECPLCKDGRALVPHPGS